MSILHQHAEPASKVTTKEFKDDLGNFQRTEKGSFVTWVDKDGNFKLKKIASHAVRVSKVVFVISTRDVEIRYILQFHTGTRFVEVIVRHTEINDERAFLGAAPPGFSVGTSQQSFQSIREMLMLDLNKATHIAELTSLGWYAWKKKPVFAHAGGVICADSDAELLSNVVFEEVDSGGGFGGGGFGFLGLVFGFAQAVDEFLALE